MSLARQFLREFRPLFRMLEEPFGRSAYAPYAGRRRTAAGAPTSYEIINEPFFNTVAGVGANVPAVDVSEKPDAFVVEAELPGVKKENLDLKIGDDGQSVTIEGRTFVQSRTPSPSEGQPETTSPGGQQGSSEVTQTNGDQKSPTQTDNNQSTQLSTERVFTGASSFSRTIWLPRRVDPSNVSAKLEDGILTVRIPKAEDRESVKVNIE